MVAGTAPQTYSSSQDSFTSNMTSDEHASVSSRPSSSAQPEESQKPTIGCGCGIHIVKLTAIYCRRLKAWFVTVSSAKRKSTEKFQVHLGFDSAGIYCR